MLVCCACGSKSGSRPEVFIQASDVPGEGPFRLAVAGDLLVVMTRAGDILGYPRGGGAPRVLVPAPPTSYPSPAMATMAGTLYVLRFDALLAVQDGTLRTVLAFPPDTPGTPMGLIAGGGLLYFSIHGSGQPIGCPLLSVPASGGLPRRIVDYGRDNCFGPGIADETAAHVLLDRQVYRIVHSNGVAEPSNVGGPGMTPFQGEIYWPDSRGYSRAPPLGPGPGMHVDFPLTIFQFAADSTALYAIDYYVANPGDPPLTQITRILPSVEAFSGTWTAPTFELTLDSRYVYWIQGRDVVRAAR